MGNAITKHQESAGSALAPRSFEDVLRFADMLAKSDLVPRDYKGKPGNIVAAVQMGAEIGLSPMQALAGIAVINGRAAVWGDAMLALVQGHSECEDIEETLSADGSVATCTVKRRGRSPVTRTFSMAEAQKAGLANKEGPWRNYPRRMLAMRARAFALRDSFADALRGIGIVEELRDIPVRETRATVVREASRAPSTPPPALPPALPPSPSNAELLSGTPSDEPDDELVLSYEIPFGKNRGKTLADLDSRSLSWYAEQFKPTDDEGRMLQRFAAAALDIRRTAKAAEAAVEREKLEADDGWDLDGTSEAEAEVMHAEHDG